jgi:hypothetical protein
MKHPLQHLAYATMLAALAMPSTVFAQEKAVSPISGVVGKLQSFTGSSVDVMTASGTVHIEQADGKQIAKQILIFPAELSRAAEGSVLTDPPGATTHSRMTNGSVSSPSVSHSRMTNGTVQKGSGTTLVVRYQDGSQTISVPPNVPVTEVVPQKVTFAQGDAVYAATEKLPDGTLVTNKIFLFIPAASH